MSHLLIIEDVDQDCQLLLRHLNKNNFDVTSYVRVDTAENLRKSLGSDKWEIIISDYRMPEFDALSALAIKQELRPQLPFIIVSGTIGEELAVEALRAGANDYVLKTNLTRLVPALERELKESKARDQGAKVAEALEKSEADLRQSQKLDAIGHLASGIAHDFNNILAVITAQTEILMESLEAKNKAASGDLNSMKKGLEQILKSSDRASRLTRQLLAFARKQNVQIKAININELLSELREMIVRLVEENIEIGISLDAGGTCIMADRGQLEQVIMNLVVNARDAMPAGGSLSISARSIAVSPIEAIEFGIPPGSYVEIVVSDTGTGIAPEIQNRIFDPFFTTKPVGEGTGLGLSTVYGIVKQTGGRISVESEKNRGTRFRVLFPVVQEPEREQPPAKNNPSLLDDLKGDEFALVVEDEPELREIICELLVSNGYAVAVARDGVEALHKLTQYPGRFPIVICDMIMPRLGGLDLYEKAKTIAPKIKFLFLSGYTDKLCELKKGAADWDFMEKPFSQKALLQKVRVLIDT